MRKPRLLLLLNPSENRRLLIKKLSLNFDIVLPDELADELPDEVLDELPDGLPDELPDGQPASDSLLGTAKFDLIICNLVELGRMRVQIGRWRQEAEPLFMPVLALMPKNTVGTLPADVRCQIDELVTVPIDPDELDVRIELLLRSRRLSTQLAQQNQKLEALNTLKTRFVSMVSHEFRSPLSVISGITQLLQMKGQSFSPEKKQDMFQRVQKVITKLTTLLDDLLILSRNTSSQVSCNPQPIDIHRHCKNLIENLQLSTAKDRDIRLEAQGELSSVRLDIGLVDTILSNLLSNAIKYSPQTTPISLHIKQQNSHVIFQVSDQGQGIPLSDQPALFDAFFRARNVGTIPGTGLGLSILKQCVDLHNGTVKVDSIPESETTFTVTLPCV